MKKYYIKPVIGRKFMVVSSLMAASVEHIHTEDQAGTGGSGSGVNFSRRGDFWEDTE